MISTTTTPKTNTHSVKRTEKTKIKNQNTKMIKGKKKREGMKTGQEKREKRIIE